MTKPSLSLCMIMKNEERWIAQCLRSVQGLVDEIVIVDTGSTDGSIAIAESFGAKVFSHAWEDDFSKSRNRAIDYATSDWVLILDADEVIAAQDKQQILDLIAAPPAPLVFLVQTNYIECSETYGWVPNTLNIPESKEYAGHVDSSLVRLFRRDAARFQGVVHEHAEPTAPIHSLYWSKIRIHHYGKYSTPDVMQKKNDLYFRLGQKKLELNPTTAQPYYELGAQYIELGKLDEAKAVLLQGEKIEPLYSRIQLTLAHIEMVQNDKQSAISRFLKVLDTEPKNIAPYIYLPSLFIDMGQLEFAEDLLIRGESVANKFPPYHVNMGALKMKQGNYRKAVKSYQKALEINPKQYQAHLSVANCHMELQEWEKTDHHFKSALASPKFRLDALKGLGTSCFKQKKYDEALEYVESAIQEAKSDTLEKNLLYLWKAILLVMKKEPLSAKKVLQKISNFNDFEEVHLNSLNDCLKKISATDNKGAPYGNEHTHL